MMFQKIFAALFAVLILGAERLTQIENQSPRPSNRSLFARRIKKIIVTDEQFNDNGETIHYNSNASDKRSVLALLGEPDDVWTPVDDVGLGTGQKTLCYGSNAHLSLPTLGRVVLDRHGRVCEVFGSFGMPPAANLFTEHQLRDLLITIDLVPDWRSINKWDPSIIIGVINKLQSIGRKRAIAALTEYIRVTAPVLDLNQRLGGSSGGLFSIASVLFDEASPGDSWYQTRCFDGVPFLVKEPLGGFSGSFSFYLKDINYYRNRKRFLKSPLTPKSGVFEEILSHYKENREIKISNDSGDITTQLLRLFEPAVLSSAELRAVRNARHPAAPELRWKDLNAKLTGKRLKWMHRMSSYAVE